jgi:hypothetical protein
MLTMHGSDMFDLISIVNFWLGSADSSTIKDLHLHFSACEIKFGLTVSGIFI